VADDPPTPNLDRGIEGESLKADRPLYDDVEIRQSLRGIETLEDDE